MNWEYIAGFFDGEGSISTGIPRCGGVSFQIRFTQVHGGVMDKISKFLTEQGIKHGMRQYHKVGSLGKQPQWVIFFSSRDSVQKFTKHIAHRLTVKKVLAQDVNRFLTLYPSLKAFDGHAFWKGKAMSPEHRQKISDGVKRYQASKNG